jgi:hypothetical protein
LARKRWIWIGAIMIVAMLAIGGYFVLRAPLAFANIAITYAAKQTCTCVFVAGRELESCITDFPEDAQRRIKVSVDADRVRAKAYGLFHAEAVHEEGFGCRIVD